MLYSSSVEIAYRQQNIRQSQLIAEQRLARRRVEQENERSIVSIDILQPGLGGFLLRDLRVQFIQQ